MGIDLVAASFVRRREDVEAIREILDHGGKRVEIIAKIENQEGFNNLEDILKVADGVMVARGDLGVEVNSEYVPVLQRRLLQKQMN